MKTYEQVHGLSREKVEEGLRRSSSRKHGKRRKVQQKQANKQTTDKRKTVVAKRALEEECPKNTKTYENKLETYLKA